MIISVTFHRLATAFESPCHRNHSLSPKCSDCVSICPCFCHPLLTIIQPIPWTWLSCERSVWPLIIFRLVLRRTRNDSEYLQLEMHNIIKKLCVGRCYLLCSITLKRCSQAVLCVRWEKSQPNVPTAMMQCFFQMQSKLIGPIKHACHRIFMGYHLLCGHFFSGCHQLIKDIQ